MSNFNIGEEVYAVYKGCIAVIVKGKVKTIITDQDNNIIGYDLIRADQRQAAPDSYLTNYVFKTKIEAQNFIINRHNDAIKTYCDSITDINSLVSFCMNNCVSWADEYTDYEARQAVMIKAKEFGIELDLK